MIFDLHTLVGFVLEPNGDSQDDLARYFMAAEWNEDQDRYIVIRGLPSWVVTEIL